MFSTKGPAEGAEDKKKSLRTGAAGRLRTFKWSSATSRHGSLHNSLKAKRVNRSYIVRGMPVKPIKEDRPTRKRQNWLGYHGKKTQLSSRACFFCSQTNALSSSRKST